MSEAAWARCIACGEMCGHAETSVVDAELERLRAENAELREMYRNTERDLQAQNRATEAFERQAEEAERENAELKRLDAGYAVNMALLSWLKRYHAEAEKARVAWVAAGPEFDAEDVLELVFDLNRWVLNNPKPGAGT